MKLEMIFKTINETYVKYFLIFLLFYFLGRSFYLTLTYFFNKNIEEEKVFGITPTILFPIYGYFILGNFLVIINFITPTTSFFSYLVILVFLSINFFRIDFKFLNKITFDNFIFYVFVPVVILSSAFDINYHYDAALYHLNHQNWLRESNLVIGMVNIFWPFGISSLNEYVASIFWGEFSLINLHYIGLIIIHSFYNFLYFNIRTKSNNFLKYSSIFIILFSLLDNFGLNGGRNGFIYIQEIGKQDTQVAILVIISTLMLIYSFTKFSISKLELSTLSLFILFSFQLKISSAYLVFWFLIFFVFSIYTKSTSINKFLSALVPTLLFGAIWVVKNYLINGCFIFPINSTCLNSFFWYREGSTKNIEIYTSKTSIGFNSYFTDSNLNIINWFNDFFINNEFYGSFYRGFYINFLISFIILYLIKKFLFKQKHYDLKIQVIIFFFVSSSLLYLLFFGPIPRYSTGILSATIGLLGSNITACKFKLDKRILILIFVSSLILLPRINSYKTMLNNFAITLPDPRFEWNYDEIDLGDGWIAPKNTDICWINLYCTSEVGDPIKTQNGFFKTMYREK